MCLMQDIVADLGIALGEEEKSYIVGLQRDDLIRLHHSLGTFIRNKYGLWYDSPITEEWRNNPSSRKIVDGVDISEDHPDAVSMTIISMLHHQLTKSACP